MNHNTLHTNDNFNRIMRKIHFINPNPNNKNNNNKSFSAYRTKSNILREEEDIAPPIIVSSQSSSSSTSSSTSSPPSSPPSSWPSSSKQQNKNNRHKQKRRLRRTMNYYWIIRIGILLLAVFFVLYNMCTNFMSMYHYNNKMNNNSSRTTTLIRERGQQTNTTTTTKTNTSFYKLWDHVTGTIDGYLIEEEQYQKQKQIKRKKSSFELLEEVLKEQKLQQQQQHQQQQQQQQQDEEDNKQQQQKQHQPLLSCFEPDWDRTNRAVIESLDSSSSSSSKQQQQQFNANNIGLPLLNVGMPKVGSSSLLRFLRHDLKWNVSHNIITNTNINTTTNSNNNSKQQKQHNSKQQKQQHSYVGQLMKQAIDNGLSSPFALLSSSSNYYQAHTQMDYTIISTSSSSSSSSDNMNFFPQISLLDEIHYSTPNATFVLLFRPINDWIRSVKSWHRLQYRWMEGAAAAIHNNNNNNGSTPIATNNDIIPTTQIPGLLLTESQRTIRKQNPYEPLAATDQQLKDWWCTHINHIRKFVNLYPSHTLLELDLYNKNNKTTNALQQLFYSDNNHDNMSITWGEANSNPDAKTAIGSNPNGPISMSTKYYQLWNYTTHTLNTANNKSSNSTMMMVALADSEKENNPIPTSLEILENILKEQQKDQIRRREQKKKEGGGDNDDKCFRPQPYKVSTTTTTLSSQSSPSSIELPIINIGLPMDVWNNKLRDFFSCQGLKVVHRKALGSNGKIRIGNTGKKMFEAVTDAHVPPLSGYFGKNRQIFTAMDYTPALSSSSTSGSNTNSYKNKNKHKPVSAYFPQIQLLDEIHEESPSSTFLLPFFSPDNINDWLNWTQNFHNFTERWARSDIPGLILTKEQRIAKQYPCKIIETDNEVIDHDNTSKGEIPIVATEMETASLRRCVQLSDDQLRDWWCGHVKHIRKFVETYNNSHKLIELDLSNKESTIKTIEDIINNMNMNTPIPTTSTSTSIINTTNKLNQTCIDILFF